MSMCSAATREMLRADRSLLRTERHPQLLLSLYVDARNGRPLAEGEPALRPWWLNQQQFFGWSRGDDRV